MYFAHFLTPAEKPLVRAQQEETCIKRIYTINMKLAISYWITIAATNIKPHFVSSDTAAATASATEDVDAQWLVDHHVRGLHHQSQRCATECTR